MGIKRTLAIAGLTLALVAAPVSMKKFVPKTDGLMAGTKNAAQETKKKTNNAQKAMKKSFENEISATLQMNGVCEIDENVNIRLRRIIYEMRGSKSDISAFADIMGRGVTVFGEIVFKANMPETFVFGNTAYVIEFTGVNETGNPHQGVSANFGIKY